MSVSIIFKSSFSLRWCSNFEIKWINNEQSLGQQLFCLFKSLQKVSGRQKGLSDTHCPDIRAGPVDVAARGCWTVSSGCPPAATGASWTGGRPGRSRSAAAAFCDVRGSSETKPGRFQTAIINKWGRKDSVNLTCRESDPASWCQGR